MENTTYKTEILKQMKNGTFLVKFTAENEKTVVMIVSNEAVESWNDDSLSASVNQIDFLENLLNENDFNASQWNDTRIYLNGYGRDIKAFFIMEDDYGFNPKTDDALAGTALKVYSNCNQSRNWLINRAKKTKWSIMVDLYNKDLIEDVCDTWQEIIL